MTLKSARLPHPARSSLTPTNSTPTKVIFSSTLEDDNDSDPVEFIAHSDTYLNGELINEIELEIYETQKPNDQSKIIPEK